MFFLSCLWQRIKGLWFCFFFYLRSNLWFFAERVRTLFFTVWTLCCLIMLQGLALWRALRNSLRPGSGCVRAAFLLIPHLSRHFVWAFRVLLLRCCIHVFFFLVRQSRHLVAYFFFFFKELKKQNTPLFKDSKVLSALYYLMSLALAQVSRVGRAYLQYRLAVFMIRTRRRLLPSTVFFLYKLSYTFCGVFLSWYLSTLFHLKVTIPLQYRFLLVYQLQYVSRTHALLYVIYYWVLQVTYRPISNVLFSIRALYRFFKTSLLIVFFFWPRRAFAFKLFLAPKRSLVFFFFIWLFRVFCQTFNRLWVFFSYRKCGLSPAPADRSLPDPAKTPYPRGSKKTRKLLRSCLLLLQAVFFQATILWVFWVTIPAATGRLVWALRSLALWQSPVPYPVHSSVGVAQPDYGSTERLTLGGDWPARASYLWEDLRDLHKYIEVGADWDFLRVERMVPTFRKDNLHDLADHQCDFTDPAARLHTLDISSEAERLVLVLSPTPPKITYAWPAPAGAYEAAVEMFSLFSSEELSPLFEWDSLVTESLAKSRMHSRWALFFEMGIQHPGLNFSWGPTIAPLQSQLAQQQTARVRALIELSEGVTHGARVLRDQQRFHLEMDQVLDEEHARRDLRLFLIKEHLYAAYPASLVDIFCGYTGEFLFARINPQKTTPTLFISDATKKPLWGSSFRLASPTRGLGFELVPPTVPNVELIRGFYCSHESLVSRAAQPGNPWLRFDLNLATRPWETVKAATRLEAPSSLIAGHRRGRASLAYYRWVGLGSVPAWELERDRLEALPEEEDYELLSIEPFVQHQTYGPEFAEDFL